MSDWMRHQACLMAGALLKARHFEQLSSDIDYGCEILLSNTSIERVWSVSIASDFIQHSRLS